MKAPLLLIVILLIGCRYLYHWVRVEAAIKDGTLHAYNIPKIGLTIPQDAKIYQIGSFGAFPANSSEELLWFGSLLSEKGVTLIAGDTIYEFGPIKKSIWELSENLIKTGRVTSFVVDQYSEDPFEYLDRYLVYYLDDIYYGMKIVPSFAMERVKLIISIIGIIMAAVMWENRRRCFQWFSHKRLKAQKMV